MRKTVIRSTTLYNFAQRADLVLSTGAADLLTVLLLHKEALRRKWKEPDFRQSLVDYGLVSVTALAGGALLSLVTTFL